MIKNIFILLSLSLLLMSCHHESLQIINPSVDDIKLLYSEAGTTALGKKDAPVTLVEIFAYDCRYCRQDYPLIEQFVKEHPNVRVIFKPFMAFGSRTKVLPQYAALAAAEQGQFLAMHRALITTNRRLTLRTIDKIAKELNLKMLKFHQDLDSAPVVKQIQQNTELMDRLDVDAIPTVIITQTRLMTDPAGLSNKIPEYIQSGFMSNDTLLILLHKVQEDARMKP